MSSLPSNSAVAAFILVCLACCAGAPPPAPSAVITSTPSGEGTFPSLSSLSENCTLRVTTVGYAMVAEKLLAISCGDEEFFVVHPWNLLGHVAISTEEQALEYVRFFTAVDTYSLVLLGGALEVSPDDEWTSDLFAIRELADEYAAPVVQHHATASGGFYSVTRFVVELDQTVKRVVESVHTDGFYSRVSEDVVVEDVTESGWVHQRMVF